MRIALGFIVLLLPLTWAHDWSELNSPEFTRERLDALIGFAETLQAEVPAGLVEGDSARAWLVWLENALGLSAREQQRLLSERLNQSLYTSEEDAFFIWQHEMEHIALVYDALVQEVNQAALSAELESLDLTQENAYARAADLSYLLMLAEVTQTDKTLLEPFLPRLRQLILQAGVQQ